MKNNSAQSAFSYLSNFKEEKMKSVLEAYEQYVKRTNSVRIVGFLVLGMVGVGRLLQGQLPKSQLITITVVVLLAMIFWLSVIVYKIIKQKKVVKGQLQSLANARNYPFREVRKEFNIFVKTHYKGPKI